MRREENLTESIRKYIQNAPSSLNGGYLPDIKQWMINRYFQIEKEWAYIEKSNWDWLIKNIDTLAPKDSKFRFIKIEKDLEPVFTINDKECYLEELSTGFQSILSMVLAIFEWIEATNEKDDKLVKNAAGTVIIDELDVHLHPEWQLILRDSLEVMFPKLQFIVTTHSPHLIASAKEGEIIVVPEKNTNLDLYPRKDKYSGWNTDQILSELMGVKSLDNKEYFRMVEKGMEYINEPILKDYLIL
ncbi:AAA ATPase domain protein [[Clostridium] sordellii ATCC 9714]|nr:AAA ATPase domain protein [[Clostridium] sordellii ATCC 9714] [Paeniclostridium sordellii ATCC 9714]